LFYLYLVELKPFAEQYYRQFQTKFYLHLVELKHLCYIGLFNYRYWKSGDFIPGEEWSWFETLDEDIKDSSIPCEEKRKALKLLWSNIKEFLRKGYKPISYYPEKPKAY
jgi:hypothetical protein